MMGLLAPAFLGLAALAVPIIILYMLRLRRREVPVSSTLLWRLVVRDREANAPWQRLKRNLLMLLQLLVLAALVLALARPWIPSQTVAQGNLVILLDASASMAAADVAPSRFAAAQGVVRALIDGLGVQDTLTLISVGRQPRVLISQSEDKPALLDALSRARAETGPADWTAAFALAIGQARSTQQPTTVVVSDGGLPDGLPPLPGTVRYVQVGSGADNLAISALAARQTPAGTELFVGVSNSGSAGTSTVVDVSVDGRLYGARNLDIPARGSADFVMTLPPAARLARAHVANGGALALDDDAWAVVPGESGGPVLLLTAGNVFLERALALMPGVTPYRGDPAKPLPTGTAFDVTILDGVLPVGATPGTASLPPGDLLIIAPPESSEAFEVTGVFSDTQITDVQAEHPILRYVSTSSWHIRRARAVQVPDWAQVLIRAEGGPLLLAGERDGRRIAILTFDLHDSDLPLQVAFPILLANLFQWYAPAQMFLAPAGLVPGQPLVIQPPAGAGQVSVQEPDGTIWKGSDGGAEFTFAETGQLGTYTVTADTPSGPVEQSFAVNLFAPEEADIRPRDTIVVGTVPLQPAQTEAMGQREIWPWIAGLALGVLAVEWWVYHRGTVLPRRGPQVEGRPLKA